MRSHLLASHFRALSKASALIIVAVTASACSNDASRLDEFITASTQVSKPKAGVGQSVAQTRQAATPLAAAPRGAVTGRSLAPAVMRNDLPRVTETPVANTLQTGGTTAAVSQVAPRVGSQPGALVLAPRKRIASPLRVAGTDKLTTGGVAPSQGVVTRVIQQQAQSQVLNQAGKAKKKVWDNSKGARITVQKGETLYNISRRYGVPVSAIMKANSLTNADSVVAGSRIQIPAYNYSASAPVSAPDNDPTTRASRASRGFQGQARGKLTVPKTRAEKPRKVAIAKPKLPQGSGSSGTYTVESGDSLYGIAKRKGVSAVALREANNMTGNDLRIGQKLVIPPYGSRKDIAMNQNVDHRNTGAISSQDTKSSSNSTKYSAPSAAPTIKQRSTEKVAKVAKASASTFRWPVQGRVVAKFGQRLPSGTNDGIDIAVPVGTPVKATENGTVIYSGSELEDFGKLILVSHANGWVSAYAHASSALVRRGDKVRRGQVIAKSGRTGNATTPKLHFELRKNSNPVNPLKHLAR